MKFLIDTNILIPLEPTKPSEIESGSDNVSEFLRIALDTGNQIYLHPNIKTDFERDRDHLRKALREQFLKRYTYLTTPPAITSDLESILGPATEGSNDWVDNSLIAALSGDAVDYLVTDDDRIHKKAKRLDLSERVLTTSDALAVLRKFYDTTLAPPPAVGNIPAYSLNEKDSILDELRQDYPDFDGWIKKCKREHRTVWVIQSADNKRLAAICIIKKETSEQSHGLKGKVMKICLFKVSPDFAGYRYGELLLKTVFQHAHENSYDGIFVTTFEKHQALIELLNDFGFVEIAEKTLLGELILAKRLKPSPAEVQQLDALTLNIRFGPFITRFDGTPCFIIPIMPSYHEVLFPEAAKQASLFSGQYPFGNSIRKAYLSKSIIKNLPKGANVLFYRSGDARAITAIGIVEATMKSNDPVKIARFVGKRTVYSIPEINRMAQGNVLAILFRQIKILKRPITYTELVKEGILKGPPQSITSVPEKGKIWLSKNLTI